MGGRPHARPALRASRAAVIGRTIFRPLMLGTGIAGVVEVLGRRSGTPFKLTLALWDVDGNRYLMSQYGLTEWARNLRAAGGGKLKLKGRTHAFTAIEVDGEERDRVIAAFRAKTDRFLRRDFDRLPDPADHPTFRLSMREPEADAGQP